MRPKLHSLRATQFPAQATDEILQPASGKDAQHSPQNTAGMNQRSLTAAFIDANQAKAVAASARCRTQTRTDRTGFGHRNLHRRITRDLEKSSSLPLFAGCASCGRRLRRSCYQSHPGSHRSRLVDLRSGFISPGCRLIDLCVRLVDLGVGILFRIEFLAGVFFHAGGQFRHHRQLTCQRSSRGIALQCGRPSDHLFFAAGQFHGLLAG